MNEAWDFAKLAELFMKATGILPSSLENARYLLSALAQGLAAMVSMVFSLSFIAVQMGDKSLHNYRIEKLKKDWKFFLYSWLLLIWALAPLYALHQISETSRWLQTYGLWVIGDTVLSVLFIFLFLKHIFLYLDRKRLTNALVDDILSHSQESEQFSQFWETFILALTYKEQTVAALLLNGLIRKIVEGSNLRDEDTISKVIKKLVEGLNLHLSVGIGEDNHKVIATISMNLNRITKASDLKNNPASLYALILVFFSLLEELQRISGEGTNEPQKFLSREILRRLAELTRQIFRSREFYAEKLCSTLLKKWGEVKRLLPSIPDGSNIIGDLIRDFSSLISSDSPPCLKELDECLKEIPHG